MKPEEAIEILTDELRTLSSIIDYYIDLEHTESKALRHKIKRKEAIESAITALAEIQQYREIGTMEECRAAMEKQKSKKCVEDSCPDHTHYKCPSCGKIQKTKYGDSTFGCILNNCSNCGQALMDGNEDD